MKSYGAILFLFFALIAHAQTDTIDLSEGEKVFLPSLDYGYIFNPTDLLSGSVIIKTSIEYRWSNNNDVFIKLNYDSHKANYSLEDLNGLTNIVKGDVNFTDLLLGGGYRFGDATDRLLIMAQAGLKSYDFPEVSQEGNVFNIELASRNIFTTRFTIGYEFYLNDKSAFTLDLFLNRVWNNEDFWLDRGDSYGVSLGFITSLF